MQDTHLKTVKAYQRLKNLNAQAHVVRAAVNLGVIRQLKQGQHNLEQLAEACGAKPTPLRLMLEVLKQIGLVEQYGEDYALAQVGRVWPDELDDLGDRYWQHLESWLKQDQPIPVNPDTDLDFVDFEIEQAADSWLATPAALDVAEVLQVGTTRQNLEILDLFCGTAVFSLVLLHRDPTSQATLVDTPDRLAQARVHANSLDQQPQIEWVEADPLDCTLPAEQFDLIILARHVHLLHEKQLLAVLELARGALKEGGEIAIVDVFPGQPAGDVSRKIRELEVALRTHGRPLHTPQELEEMLSANSFGEVQFAHLPAPPHLYGLLLAKKLDAPTGDDDQDLGGE